MIVDALLLAAGRSQRMGGENKLLLPFQGVPLIRHVAGLVLETGCRRLFLITGHDHERITAAIKGLPLTILHNPHHASGMASSIVCGIKALALETDAALILPGDMPWLTATLIDRIIASHASTAEPQTRITIPRYQNQRGNPVIWGRDHFNALMQIEGDQGGRQLFARLGSAVNEIRLNDKAILRDVDTPDDLPLATRDAGTLPQG